jgi:4-amino-4-deoxy-L-arabinose transferase-like glycosyltransferase
MGTDEGKEAEMPWRTDGGELGVFSSGVLIRAHPCNPWLRFFSVFSSLCLGGCILFLFFYRLGDRDLWSSHEARAAQNAQGILNSGDWVLPRLYDNRPELQKPPLYYWLVAGVAWLRGGPVDAWDVRLPAALAGCGCVVVVYLLARGRGRAAALLAAAVLATAVDFTWLARVGRIDMPLTLAVTLALAGYYQGQRRRRDGAGGKAWPWFLLGYLAVAAGVLLKGPIGLALPAAVAGVDLLIAGNLTHRKPARSASEGASLARASGWPKGLGLWWGIPLVAALTVPWFWVVNERTQGELFRVFFWYHNVERGFGGDDRLAAHPWWFYGPCLALDFLPWTPALLLAGWRYWRRPGRADPLARFGLVWLVTVLVVLSCLRFKRRDYLLPAYPGAALFLATVAAGWLKDRAAAVRGRARNVLASPAFLVPAVGGLVVAGCVAGWWFYVDRCLPGREARASDRHFAAAIRRHVPAGQPVIFFCTKAHLLTFHLGRPVDTLLEWENLDWWAGRAGTYYVVMPPALVRESRRHLKSGRLVEVLRGTGLGERRRERILVLLRTVPHAGPPPP